ncbi:SDR family NAD(P)-dependent oxidoreductase [Aeromonas hydrophila]|uniref:Oxidoreductase, short-chain dehydrogenase/reductase family n=1 Tax=Aeromonas hydrophila subsp. hydrophila (strain ATCC 7966 / DSM 30187 / BCRC 13018 / CCUG 14551 / JCM 1027 / KCTC 2358 / NCIMB 9240 / NCTC 8049) TaxID=380703 RepID=A0KH94_AERHH|nr:SDR family NAD(P)-dependent oxidoreductase [Aeromonas hydrophila]ABK39779.1 oxidoreductase, short-chain dehydrogenase/reductase family [Aeromonas hydrophila subsp. hydrophila ATCC 7966]EJN6954222.1 SDR family NAD(P)-dependent oxidoreductase [Aeromonas hydrophila]KER64089.1 short-chain dehydrogenase [Aeromonas hydrophila]MBS4670314.1 SDR family NAD(P)-dependent oxidoreductase [Aeromonas hydrophila]MCX4041123.1 SDR family NAD(P)-dependent oxidoreductase [Aeromonas hydrophila]
MSGGRVLITGATSGIGFQLALDYRRAGWQVWGCGRDGERLLALGRHGITPLQFDGRDASAVSEAAASLPRVDLVILNAGNCEYMDVAEGFDGALFARIIETNLVATGHALAAFLPLLGAGGRLAIVSSSVSWLPLPRAEAYGASKAALDYLADTLRLDLAGKGIGVTLIRPGFVQTPLTAKNDFPMPCLVTVEEASRAIMAGLTAGRHQIHFPRRFIWLLRLLGALPTGLWLRLGRTLVSKGRPS